jgi:hypothetical protein
MIAPMTTTAPRFVAVAAFATFASSGAPAARATSCESIEPPFEAAFDAVTELPRNTELRFIDPTNQISTAAVFSGPTLIDSALVDDELGKVIATAEPLVPGSYTVTHRFAEVSVTIRDDEDVTAPRAPTVDVEYDPGPGSSPFAFFSECGTSVAEGWPHVLHVGGDDGDIVLLDGEARAVVRGSVVSLRAPRHIREVQLRDLAGNTSEPTTVDLTSEGGCSQGGSASPLAGLLVLLGLLATRRRS